MTALHFFFRLQDSMKGGQRTEKFSREETAYLVSFYENLYQHNTGNKKNIMAV